MDLLQTSTALFGKCSELIDSFGGEADARAVQVSTAIAKIETQRAIHGRGVLRRKIHALTGQIINNSLVAGNEDFSGFLRDDGATGEAFLHLDTGIRPESLVILSLHITGMDFYGLRSNHDARCWGYIGYGGIHSQSKNSDPLEPTFYIGSNGCGFVRLKLQNQYYNSISIDAIMSFNSNVDNFKFVGGRITRLTVETI
jgi:hypothetical protein